MYANNNRDDDDGDMVDDQDARDLEDDRYTTRSFEASIHASLIRKSEREYKNDLVDSSSKGSCFSRCCGFLNSTKFLLCTSHTLASWGNRMWSFAVGLFMIYLSQTSLRLTAIYGFVLGGAIMLFGPIMGDWVDTTPRMKFARNVLFVIDFSIALSAMTVVITVVYQAQLLTIWNGWALTLCHCIIVFFAVLGNTGSIGRMIAIERDWIVVMVKDKYELTALSALLRRIDLVTNLLAPVITGQLFTYGSIIITAVFIASWNLCFVFLEYLLLYIIYKRVPELAIEKKIIVAEDETNNNEKTPLLGNSFKSGKSNMSNKNSVAVSQSIKKKKPAVQNCMSRAFSVFITLFGGWKVYIQEETAFAGMALGFTFMTVVGFDNVTTGFAISEGLNSSIFGILSGIGSLIGVLGTIVFPIFRRKFGLLKTGMIAFTLELILLTPCVLSIFAPGSVFIWDFMWLKAPTPISPITNLTQAENMTILSTTLSSTVLTTVANGLNISNAANMTTTISSSLAALSSTTSSTLGIMTTTSMASNVTAMTTGAFKKPTSYWSVGLLMTGIIVSRFGLWMADLTVTQLLIETPKDHQRGVVNGVQNAINEVWDLTKFLLVVLIPWPQTFGYLIILTFCFICMACISFMIFSYKAKRHGYQVLSDQKERDSREAKAKGIEKGQILSNSQDLKYGTGEKA